MCIPSGWFNVSEKKTALSNFWDQEKGLNKGLSSALCNKQHQISSILYQLVERNIIADNVQ